MKSTNKKQLRATFNDTTMAQEDLRVKLDEFEENNSFVEDRKIFFNLLANSLLGLDFEKQCQLHLSDNTILKINNLGKFLRHIAYLENEVNHDFLKKYGKISKYNINIGDIWHELKFEIFGIYPEALAMSIRISKEQTHLGPSKSGKV